MTRAPGRNLGDDQDFTALPDEEIRRAVRAHLDADETVDPSEVEVSVEGGRVRLSGSVGSEVERETAERIVTDLIGVEVAENRLRVEPTTREDAASGDQVGGQVTGMAQYEFEADPELSETIGTEDPMEASDEGRSFTPPDAPGVEGLFATDPPHGDATERPRPLDAPTRAPRAERAVGRAMREAPDRALRHAATESAQQFKESARGRGEREKG